VGRVPPTAPADPDALDKWQVRYASPVNPLRGVASTRAGIVAVGGPGAILTSSDGFEWTLRTTESDVLLTDVAIGSTNRFYRVVTPGQP
jgi:hypothetical protein